MKPIVCLAAAIAAVFLGGAVTHASGPIAVYALVDKVTLEPNADAPERIQISGVFITTDGSYTNLPAKRGYLYFSLPGTYKEMALKEWADLKSVAGTRQVVGFGSAWSAKARLRKADEKPESPDNYVMGNGMVKLRPDHPQAKELLEYKDR